MFIEAAIILGSCGYKINKSVKLDEQSVRKNSRAFTKAADAQRKLEKYNQMASDSIEVNAKRKHALLTCHLKMFQEQYSVIRKIEFKKGREIEKLEKMEEIQEQVHQYMALPAVVSGEVMTDSQLLVSLALRGISGQMIKDSEKQLKLASANMSQANAVSAQVDTMCIALEGIAKHAQIVTELLQNLGMLYMKSIKNITRILKENGMDQNKYSEQDIEAINVSLMLTKVIYRIISTPMVDAEGKIEKESVKTIEEGNNLLQQITGGN